MLRTLHSKLNNGSGHMGDPLKYLSFPEPLFRQGFVVDNRGWLGLGVQLYSMRASVERVMHVGSLASSQGELICQWCVQCK